MRNIKPKTIEILHAILRQQSEIILLGMLGMPSLTVFHPGQENETRDNHYGIDNSKSSHCLFSSLSKIKPTRSGTIVAIIPTINIQYLKLDGFAN